MKPNPIDPWVSSRGDARLTRIGDDVIALVGFNCQGYTLPDDRDRLLKVLELKRRPKRDETGLIGWLDQPTPGSLPPDPGNTTSQT